MEYYIQMRRWSRINSCTKGYAQTELIKLAHEKGHFSSAKTEEIPTERVGKKGISKSVKGGRAMKHLSCRFYWIFAVYQQISTYPHNSDAFTKFTWLYPVNSTAPRSCTR
ncbi:hypothetical protein TNCV_1983851 [Trichonephila clavipes]|nr:hypothetical protein TNCV_1983851 [Trichonephila clavipes]